MAVFLAGGPINWLPDNFSSYGGEIDSLFWLITAICAVTFFATEGLLIYSLVKFRRKKGDRAQFTHGSHKLEISWTLVTGAILFFLALYQYKAWAHVKIDMPSETDPDVVLVQVLAKQFEWNFRYMDLETGRFATDVKSPFSTGELHVPVGKRILFKMRSLDVLHSLFLPHFRFKQDLIPGLTIRGWFKPEKTTAEAREQVGDEEFEFEIACAELCGILHHEMKGKVVVHTDADFEKWLQSRTEAYAQGQRQPEIWERWDEASWTESKSYAKDKGHHGEENVPHE